MGLFQKAIETYDAMEHLVGVYELGKKPLAPISHDVKRANIEVTIDKNGKFIQARKIDENIIMPVTEDSAGRTSGIVPHPLCEQVKYLTGDDKDKYTAYLKQMQGWIEYDPERTEKVNAVHKYVSGSTVKSDLLRSEVIVYDEKDDKIKKDTDLVCWRVTGTGARDTAVWTDRNLFDSFIDYYGFLISGREVVLSYISGERGVTAKQHLKSINMFQSNAKLISSNDTSNFTYRGRFFDADEALSISYIDSQKSHNALKWLASNQGIYVGKRLFICWNPHGAKIPNIMLPVKFEEDEKKEPTNYKDALNKKMLGYKTNLPENDEIIIAAFDAMTSGRLAIVYYSELTGSDFLEKMQEWDEWCCFYDNRWGISVPSLANIAKLVCGRQRGKGEDASVEAKDEDINRVMQKLLYAKLNGTSIPVNVMNTLVRKTYDAELYNRRNRNQLYLTTCAVVRKYRYDRFKEEWNMSLDNQNKDRSYQFGRLLAVMEKIERDTYKENEKREPNAIRTQNMFVRRPGYATKIVMGKLRQAYYPKLKPAQRAYYEKLIGEIMLMISESGEEAYSKPLKETYILGYYLQKNELYTKKIKDEKDENEKEDLSDE